MTVPYRAEPARHLATYKAERLASGVPAKTVRLESAAIQRFFNWRIE
jgi:hypothetical protein